MKIPKSGKHKEWYAEHCLHMVTVAKDQDDRSIQRAMPTEWIKLVDAILQSLKPTK